MSKEPKLKFAKISLPNLGKGGYVVPLTEKAILDAITTELDGHPEWIEVGDKIMIEVVEMTQIERDALPEFDGW